MDYSKVLCWKTAPSISPLPVITQLWCQMEKTKSLNGVFSPLSLDKQCSLDTWELISLLCCHSSSLLLTAACQHWTSSQRSRVLMLQALKIHIPYYLCVCSYIYSGGFTCNITPVHFPSSPVNGSTRHHVSVGDSTP